MNEWISDIFEFLLTCVHVIVILGLVIYFFSSSGTVSIMLMIFTSYVIIVGALTTFISMNKTLKRVESELKKINDTSTP